MSTVSAGADAPTLITCRPAVGEEELAAHFAIRHQVFVTEQHVFAGSDRDPHDHRPDVIHLLGRYRGEFGGAVRLFPVDGPGDVWQGDRLCVLPAYRVHGLGAPLVRCAVATAATRGGARMVAHIQLPNVTFFRRLGWQLDGDTEMYAGLEHQPMSIPLAPADAAARLVQELSAGIPAR